MSWKERPGAWKARPGQAFSNSCDSPFTPLSPSTFTHLSPNTFTLCPPTPRPAGSGGGGSGGGGSSDGGRQLSWKEAQEAFKKLRAQFEADLVPVLEQLERLREAEPPDYGSLRDWALAEKEKVGGAGCGRARQGGTGCAAGGRAHELPPPLPPCSALLPHSSQLCCLPHSHTSAGCPHPPTPPDSHSALLPLPPPHPNPSRLLLPLPPLQARRRAARVEAARARARAGGVAGAEDMDEAALLDWADRAEVQVSGSWVDEDEGVWGGLEGWLVQDEGGWGGCRGVAGAGRGCVGWVWRSRRCGTGQLGGEEEGRQEGWGARKLGPWFDPGSCRLLWL